MANKAHILFVIGDVSGLNNCKPSIEILKNQGLKTSVWGPEQGDYPESIFAFGHHQFTGFTGLFRNLLFYKNQLKDILSFVEKQKVTLCVLVDFGGFNLQLLKRLSIKTVYFIPPKTWAWGAWRNKTLTKASDLVTVFDFEQKYFQKFHPKVHYFGHPSVQNLGEIRFENFVTILPGSRASEIKAHLPILIKATEYLPQQNFKVACLSTYKDLYFPFAQNKNIEWVYDQYERLIDEAQAVWSASGTASFEVAIRQKPQIVFYKTSWLNYVMAKALAKVKFIALPNLILNKKMVPELIQRDFQVQSLLGTHGQLPQRMEFENTETQKKTFSLEFADFLQKLVKNS